MMWQGEVKHNPVNDEFFSPNELAAYLKVTPACIYMWVKRGKIPYHRIGKSLRFAKADIQALLKKSRVERKVVEIRGAV